MYDVLIVGGGQCGLTTAFGLSREQVCVRLGILGGSMLCQAFRVSQPAAAESRRNSARPRAAAVTLQVTNVLIVDENPAGLEGPWVT